MDLLISVRAAAEAAAALAGGADIIDAKDPAAGALGAVHPDTMSAISAAAGHDRTVSAALGDARNEDEVERAAHEFTARGAALVKIGFAGIAAASHASSLLAAALRGAAAAHPRGGIVAVAYADHSRAASVPPFALIQAAARAGAVGVLLDTVDKRGPGLTDLLTPGELARWVAAAHGHGLFAAVAGRLRPGDLPLVRDAGADVAGLRGAACDGGRLGTISTRRVRDLLRHCAAPPGESRTWFVRSVRLSRAP